jgi:hypothetical protein
MSQETPIGNLGGGISDEDSKLVDSILNDINSSSGPPQQQGEQGQQLSPEQMKMMQQQQMAQRQQQMAQQQMAQQQMAQQQMSQQQMSQQKMNMIQKDSNDIMDNIKLEAKNIMTVVFLCVLLNIEQVDTIFKSVSMFTSEAGGLNMQAVFIKALMIGIIFYLVKTYLL